MSSGYFGKVLWIDLTNEKFEEENLPDKIYRQYFGGYGLGCKLIYENMRPKVDALSANSIFGFFPGLLTSTAALGEMQTVVGHSDQRLKSANMMLFYLKVLLRALNMLQL